MIDHMSPIEPPPACGRGTDVSKLSRAQSLIWTGQKLVPLSPAYNMAWRFDFQGPIDEAAFRTAFDSIVSRCDALRLTFEEVEGEVRQRIESGPAGSFDLLAFANPDEAERWIDDQLGHVFELSRETFRSSLLRIGGDRWVWFFNQHHIATDAISGEVIYRELAQAYESLLSGHALGAEPMPSFCVLATQKGADGHADAQAFWQRHLSRPATLPRLYGRRGSGLSSDATRIVVSLGAERSRRLLNLVSSEDFGALSRSQAIFNILATVLCAWISRVSGLEEPSLGVVTHGRRSLEARSAAGCFVELFPLETRVEADESFRSLHAKIAQEGYDLLRNAVPGTSTSEAHARFNVVLNLISATFGDFAGEATQVAWLDSGHTDPRHALRLNVTDFGGDGAIELAFLFNDSVFDANLARRAVAHVLRLLDRFLAEPDGEVHALQLAGDDEASVALTARAAQIMAEATPVEDVVAAFGRSAAEEPRAIAVRDDRGPISREALDARSDELAAALYAAGARSGDLVGSHLTRSADLVAGLLGILKLGASFVPLDPAQPPGRLDIIAEEAGLRFTLSEDRLTQYWSGGGQRILVDETDRSAAGFPAPSDVSAPAYVLFTSGSTGRPKGVQVGRPALSRYADWAWRSYAGGGAAAWALHSAIGFDLTITSIFAPLAAGGEIRAYRESLDGPDLSILRVFEEDAVEVVKLTPAHLALVLEAGAEVRRIRSLVLGGEDLPAALARRAMDMLGPSGAVFNEYGPTEAVVGCMIHRFDAQADMAASVPIGRPAEATLIYVLDRGDNPAPDEVIGELCVAGPERLADGYLGRVAETDARFVPDPFRPSERMYRTGDLASVRPDGVVRYHGRADDQVKIGGVRIELGEIRNAVLSHPSVEACTLSFFAASSEPDRRCARCGIGSNHPDADIDDEGVCTICRGYDGYRDRAATYFKDLDELQRIVTRAAGRRTGPFDCVMMLSGGKDSTYALCRLAEITPRILAATLDNGFISEGAKENIRRVTASLGVEHRFLTTPYMNEIFVDSLERHANVCNGCFKTIYTLGLKLARDEGAPLIVTGLSRGQMFETRLTPELFQTDRTDVDEIDATVLEARKTYHRLQDAAARRLNGALFDDDSIFDEVEFADFYRYCDVPVSEVYAYLRKHVPWSRPEDTGRSTNCLINDVGIHVHKTARGYHNYALPYSWDVRMGHKTLSEARAELEDDIDEARVAGILSDIGYRDAAGQYGGGAAITCHYVPQGDLAPAELRRSLVAVLPREMIPAHLIAVDAIPLTPNGKVDHAALPAPSGLAQSDSELGNLSPRTPLEAQIHGIWCSVLRRDRLGVEDNFYDLGGDSIAAIQIATRASAEGLKITAVDVFRQQSIAALAAMPGIVKADEETRPKAKAQLDPRSKERLAAIFGRRANV